MPNDSNNTQKWIDRADAQLDRIENDMRNVKRSVTPKEEAIVGRLLAGGMPKTAEACVSPDAAAITQEQAKADAKLGKDAVSVARICAAYTGFKQLKLQYQEACMKSNGVYSEPLPGTTYSCVRPHKIAPARTL